MAERTPGDASGRLLALCDDYWELLMRRNPVWATDLGDHRYDDLLPDMSLEARHAYFNEIRGLDRQLRSIPEQELAGQDAITHEVLRAVLEVELAAEPHIDDRWTINPLHGPAAWLSELIERQPLVPEQELSRLIRRFERVPALFDQIEGHLRDGMAGGATAPRIGAERMARQIRRVLEADPARSAFMPQAEPPAGITAGAWDDVRNRIAEVVGRTIYPSLARHADFLEQTYLPAARESYGLYDIPGGLEYYQYLVRYYTGRTDSAQEIHQIGMDELHRIHEEMEEIADRTYGIRDVREMAGRLRARTDQYLPDRDALLAHNRALLERANAALGDWFHLLPQRRCEVRPIEEYREADSPSGYYNHAPDDASRPAYYYVNTYRPDQRPLYNMEALAFHEAVPGHHLQIAIAQDLQGLPVFRRQTGQTAYIEGWALYSERLSDEMGLYTNDLTRFGMLNYQAWRAGRLVIDTGIHALGWSRERSINTFLENTAHTEAEASLEVDRYICMPGQALSYMIGRMHIDALRATAKSRLGARFNIKDFHDKVLENGAVPLVSLTRIIERWLDQAAA